MAQKFAAVFLVCVVLVAAVNVALGTAADLGPAAASADTDFGPSAAMSQETGGDAWEECYDKCINDCVMATSVCEVKCETQCEAKKAAAKVRGIF